jgi:hypothetical protein
VRIVGGLDVDAFRHSGTDGNGCRPHQARVMTSRRSQARHALRNQGLIQ